MESLCGVEIERLQWKYAQRKKYRTTTSTCESEAKAWFKVAVLVTDSDGLETYRSWCIGCVSADTQKKMIKIFKKY